MIRAFYERQARDDLGRGIELQRAPPGAGSCDVEGGHEAEISREADTAATTPAAPMWGTNGTVKPK